MLTTPNESKRRLKKTRKLSQIFDNDSFEIIEMNRDAGSSEPLFAEAPSKINDPMVENWVARSLPSESFAGARRTSSIVSGQSLSSTIEDLSTSSEAGSQSGLVASTEHLRRGKAPPRVNRQLGENIPPSPNRRQSFDFSTRGGSGSPGELQRSRSLWSNNSQKRREALDEAAGEFQDRYLRNFGTGTMSERQRTLNVKRARKMTQVRCPSHQLDSSNCVCQLFGQEPPSELIQIHDERESDHFRDSTATLLTATHPLRDRANSTASIGTIANDLEVEEEVPRTPPPFATFEIPDPVSAPATTTSFQERRRRAAKLSRFFGVGFQDISLGETAPPPPVAIAKEEVDVKVSTGRRFWSFNDRAKEGDMQEAIQKLRGLKAG
ncbi:hypothetical protein C8F04DRAFT_1076290 [Mycena alexandri]|uniref:Uncharacterized protein n=1 Tax=Mycena alexandri TaxID=1745969 RepID=A0AAD6TEM4_9AGAR|nr:hypothetical protein C8F04DRAFT_1076290 [Mycena alexandri]